VGLATHLHSGVDAVAVEADDELTLSEQLESCRLGSDGGRRRCHGTLLTTT
jgi:hypothetical protein